MIRAILHETPSTQIYRNCDSGPRTDGLTIQWHNATTKPHLCQPAPNSVLATRFRLQFPVFSPWLVALILLTMALCFIANTHKSFATARVRAMLSVSSKSRSRSNGIDNRPQLSLIFNEKRETWVRISGKNECLILLTSLGSLIVSILSRHGTL